MLTRVLLLLVLLFVPQAATAQSGEQALPYTWDIAGSVGLFAGRTQRSPDATGYQELWFENVQGGVTMGRYFTRHLKLELEASTTTRGTQFRERLITRPETPYPYPVGSEVTTSVPSVSASLVWQFRDNEWVHPFVQAGVCADFDRETVRTWEQFAYPPQPGLPPQRIVEERIDGPHTRAALRVVVGGGAKVYFTPRAFVRTDGRWSFDADRQNLAMRIGVGVDF